jgi:hypothetical protein
VGIGIVGSRVEGEGGVKRRRGFSIKCINARKKLVNWGKI